MVKVYTYTRALAQTLRQSSTTRVATRPASSACVRHKNRCEMTEPRAPDSDEVDSDDEVGSDDEVDSDEAPVTGPDEWTVHYDE